MTFSQEHIFGRPDLIASEYGAHLTLKRSGDQFMARCPFHEDRTPSLSIRAETGEYHCFGCGAEGDLPAFKARVLGVPVAEAMDELRQRHGLGGNGNGSGGAPRPAVALKREPPPDAMLQWLALSTEDDEGTAYLKARKLWPLPEGLVRFAVGDDYRVAVPLYDANGDLVNVQRRAIRDAGEGRKLVGIKGGPTKGTAIGVLTPGKPVWLVEGLTDWIAGSILAATLDVIVLGIPGASNAESLIEARAQALAGRTVYVSMDNDETGQKAEQAAVEALTAAGAVPIVARYPAGFKDLAELVEKLGAEKAAELMAEVMHPAPEEVTPVGVSIALSDLLATPPPAVEWRIEGIAPVHSRIGLIGRPKIGKSLFELYAGLCVAAEVDWYGRKVKPGRVLYIDEENHRSVVYERIRRMMKAHPAFTEPEVLERFRIANLAGLTFKNIDALRREVEFAKPDYLIFDSWRRVFRGEENSSQEVSEAFEALTRIQLEFGCDIKMLHHTRKNIQGEEFWEDGARGSGDLFAALDGMIGATKCGKGMLQVRASLRAAEEPEPFNVELNPETLIFELTTASVEEPFDSFHAIEELLRDQPGNCAASKAVKALLMTRFNRTESQAKKAVARIPEVEDKNNVAIGIRIGKRVIPGSMNERLLFLTADALR